MEGAEGKIAAMTDVEFDILDEVYFVTAYIDIRTQLGISDADLAIGLHRLLQKGYIKQLQFDETAGDFIKLESPDYTGYSTYHYLATKAGLLAHNL